MDGSWTLLDSKAPPCLFFVDWAISVHDEVLRFAVVVLFLSEKFDSVLPAAHSRQCFPRFSGRSVSQRRRDRFGYLSHSLVCLSYQLAYLQYWVICLVHPRLAPSQTASLCVFHGIVERVVGIFDDTEVCFDLLHFLSGLHWWEV